MEKVMDVASYIYNRYKEEYGEKIDEMKLQKLMYFSQRESLIQNNEPLFDAVFYGWKYGPVLKEIRAAYKEDAFLDVVPEDVVSRILPVMDKVFEEYASRESMSLSRLSHGEQSWKNSRIGVREWENSNNPMQLSDIAEDAARIRERRETISKIKKVQQFAKENN